MKNRDKSAIAIALQNENNTYNSFTNLGRAKEGRVNQGRENL